MFAFAILDERARRLFLARDRAGIKPLVYAWDGRRLLFASEIKGILEDPGVPRELDWDALGDYLTYHYVPAPRTIFKAIRKLPPASTLVQSLDGGEPVSPATGPSARIPTRARRSRSGSSGSGLSWRMPCRATWSATCPSAPS
jgi:asparagine synthetase B (glutamine-hydrolysing)